MPDRSTLQGIWKTRWLREKGKNVTATYHSWLISLKAITCCPGLCPVHLCELILTTVPGIEEVAELVDVCPH